MNGLPGVQNLGKDITVQGMRYQDAMDNMEPLCDHCRKKLTNQILPHSMDRKTVFQLGSSLYQVEKIS